MDRPYPALARIPSTQSMMFPTTARPLLLAIALTVPRETMTTRVSRRYPLRRHGEGFSRGELTNGRTKSSGLVADMRDGRWRKVKSPAGADAKSGSWPNTAKRRGASISLGQHTNPSQLFRSCYSQDVGSWQFGPPLIFMRTPF